MIIYEINDLCALLRIGKSTAYALVREKEIPAFKIHGIWKITEDSLNKYIGQHSMSSH
jgi:excisionase family DNA binding protein